MAWIVSDLPSESVHMYVVEMQNPSTLWLADVINKQISKKFYDMEERLKQVLERGKPQYCNRMLNVGDIIAVYDSVSDAWCRGKICDIYQKLSKYVYNVFLVDRGYSISSDPSNIKELPSEACTLQFRCYHVQLYGVIPISPPNTIASPENLDLQSWLPECVIEVKKLLDTCEAVYFTPKVARRTVYGDIYLKFDCGFLRLSDYLCENKFAIYNNNSFELMMETAPYMSCQQGFSSNSSKGNRSISDYIKDSQGTDEIITFQEENESKNPRNGYEDALSEYRGTNKTDEKNNTVSNEDKPNKIQKRTSALQQYYEEMRRGDMENTESDFRTVPDTGTVVQKAHKRDFRGIGRGERLKMLQKLSAGKKPGGSYCNETFSDEITNKSEDEHMLVDELCNMSVNERKRPGYARNQFCARIVPDGEKTEMDNSEYPIQSHIEKQHMMKRPVHWGNSPASNANIFCRPSKLMFLPAGSEMSMLVPRKKERNDKKYPTNFTGSRKINSSNTFSDRK